MRLHRLEMTGIGPFRDSQVIDFDRLTESGLFLIEGPTGSGKTTIIDAIVYALFGIVSGGSASDATRIRSSYCRDTDPTGVTLEFSVGRQRRIIKRIPAGARDPEEPNRRASSRPARQSLQVLEDGGNVREVLTRADEITAHVEALLGMKAEQFRHLAVLPQGQFADLLRKSPLERMHSLAPLLGDSIYQDLQKDLEAAGRAAEEQRARASADVLAATQRLLGRLRPDLDDAATPGFAVEEANDDDRRTSLANTLTDIAERAETAHSLHARLRVQNTSLREALGAAERTRSLVEALEQRQAFLQAAQDEVAAAERDLPEQALVELVDELTRREGSLAEYVEWESRADDRARELGDMRDAGHTARAHAASLRQALAALPEDRRRLDERIAGLEREAATLDATQRAEAELTAQVEKAERLTSRLPSLDAAQAALSDCLAREVRATEAVAASFDEWRALESHRLTQQAALLAAELQPGAPCSVCGSLEHPNPAARPHDDLVSDDAVALTLAAYEAAQLEQSTASAATSSSRSEWESMRSEVDLLRGAVGDATVADLRARLDALIITRTLASEAVAELGAARTAQVSLEQRTAELETAIAAAEQEAAALDGKAEVLGTVIAAQEEKWRAAIGSADSASSLVREVRRRVEHLNALRSCRSAYDAARDAVPPGATTLDDAREQVDSLLALVAETDTATQDAERSATALATMHMDASGLGAEFEAALTSRDDTVRQTADAIRLARLVSGTAPDNTRRLQLHSYALLRRFESVLAVASLHLERMSAGKFTFELDDRAMGSGQSGLGITILDTWTGHHQDPKSLSGGESFYASLALALGLADVVQDEARGAALETLFVDEGFGSLDQDTLALVLDQLEGLRAGGRKVGVVSHVTEMKDAIGDRVEVRRQADRTSRLELASLSAAT